MFVRGNVSGSEAKRYDDTFYRGIVVKNNDPLKLNRVKIFIPELSNQPFDNWFDEFDEISVKIAGKNNPTDNWSDTKIFEEMALVLQWAEPCFPLFGESSNGRYYKDGEISTISDCNYSEGFQTNDEEPPSLEKGSFKPSFLFEIKELSFRDAFSEPLSNYTGKCNTYSYQYRPSSHTNKAKGIIGIPEVGSKVWVFHYQGELNFPVYFGVTQDFRCLVNINNTDNVNGISNTYPNEFEN